MKKRLFHRLRRLFYWVCALVLLAAFLSTSFFITRIAFSLFNMLSDREVYASSVNFSWSDGAVSLYNFSFYDPNGKNIYCDTAYCSVNFFDSLSTLSLSLNELVLTSPKIELTVAKNKKEKERSLLFSSNRVKIKHVTMIDGTFIDRRKISLSAENIVLLGENISLQHPAGEYHLMCNVSADSANAFCARGQLDLSGMLNYDKAQSTLLTDFKFYHDVLSLNNAPIVDSKISFSGNVLCKLSNNKIDLKKLSASAYLRNNLHPVCDLNINYNEQDSAFSYQFLLSRNMLSYVKALNIDKYCRFGMERYEGTGRFSFFNNIFTLFKCTANAITNKKTVVSTRSTQPVIIDVKNLTECPHFQAEVCIENLKLNSILSDYFPAVILNLSSICGNGKIDINGQKDQIDLSINPDSPLVISGIPFIPAFNDIPVMAGPFTLELIGACSYDLQKNCPLFRNANAFFTRKNDGGFVHASAMQSDTGITAFLHANRPFVHHVLKHVHLPLDYQVNLLQYMEKQYNEFTLDFQVKNDFDFDHFELLSASLRTLDQYYSYVPPPWKNGTHMFLRAPVTYSKSKGFSPIKIGGNGINNGRAMCLMIPNECSYVQDLTSAFQSNSSCINWTSQFTIEWPKLIVESATAVKYPVKKDDYNFTSELIDPLESDLVNSLSLTSDLVILHNATAFVDSTLPFYKNIYPVDIKGDTQYFKGVSRYSFKDEVYTYTGQCSLDSMRISHSSGAEVCGDMHYEGVFSINSNNQIRIDSAHVMIDSDLIIRANVVADEHVQEFDIQEIQLDSNRFLQLLHYQPLSLSADGACRFKIEDNKFRYVTGDFDYIVSYHDYAMRGHLVSSIHNDSGMINVDSISTRFVLNNDTRLSDFSLKGKLISDPWHILTPYLSEPLSDSPVESSLALYSNTLYFPVEEDDTTIQDDAITPTETDNAPSYHELGLPHELPSFSFGGLYLNTHVAVDTLVLPRGSHLRANGSILIQDDNVHLSDFVFVHRDQTAVADISFFTRENDGYPFKINIYSPKFNYVDLILLFYPKYSENNFNATVHQLAFVCQGKGVTGRNLQRHLKGEYSAHLSDVTLPLAADKLWLRLISIPLRLCSEINTFMKFPMAGAAADYAFDEDIEGVHFKSGDILAYVDSGVITLNKLHFSSGNEVADLQMTGRVKIPDGELDNCVARVNLINPITFYAVLEGTLFEPRVDIDDLISENVIRGLKFAVSPDKIRDVIYTYGFGIFPERFHRNLLHPKKEQFFTEVESSRSPATRIEKKRPDSLYKKIKMFFKHLN